MSFGVLVILVLAGLAGPLISAGSPVLVPVPVGELAAGLVLGETGFGWLRPDEPTTAFLADVGFAMLMFTAGMHVPLRRPEIAPRLRRGAVAATIAGAVAIPAGWAAASLTHVPHPAIYAVVLAGGSAAVLIPSLDEVGLLASTDALTVAAQVAVADVAAIVSVPLVLHPGNALHAALGVVAVAALAVVLLVALRRVRGAAWARHLQLLSKRRDWALDLRLSLAVLFGLAWLADRTGASTLIAGFAVGLVVAAIGGPKRLSRQVVGVAQGFFVPLFFVVLGARIDLRAFARHGDLVVLALALVVLDLAVRLPAALATRQPVAAALAATAQLGVPAAVVSLGLQQHLVTPGAGAAIMVAAVASIGTSTFGVALLARAGPRPPG